jgi:hypothetical protein
VDPRVTLQVELNVPRYVWIAVTVLCIVLALGVIHFANAYDRASTAPPPSEMPRPR